MNKRVFIVHGWGGHPNEGWFPWLKGCLEEKGFEVFVPQLPDTEHPRIGSWVSTLAQAVDIADEQTYFVGHSMGCQTIVRYLESLPDEMKIGGVVFVAGYFKRLTNCDETPKDKITSELWMNAPIDLQKVASHLPKSVAIFSDDDPFVPFDNQEDFRNIFHSKIVLENSKGHLNGPEDGVMELPSALSALLEISFKYDRRQK